MTRRKPGLDKYTCENCLAHSTGPANYSLSASKDPENRLATWLQHLVKQADATTRPLHPCLREFQSLIESDSTIFMYFASMFEQIPKESPYTEDPLGRPQIRDYSHLLSILNHILSNAPEFNLFAHELGWVGLPINVIMNWPMSTPSGKALFSNDRVNSQFRKILNVWGEFLSSRASSHVLHDKPGGWLSPEALKALEDEAHIGDTTTSSFHEIYQCDPSLPCYGFTSWDDFFSRKLRPGVRPVDCPDDPRSFDQASRKTVVNACEAQPYRLAHNISEREHFWLKSQPYSLVDMLGHDPLALNFVGGSVFQALLGSLCYHRWHMPVSGTILRAFVQPGTYFSRAMYEGFGDGTNLKKDQGYVSAVATRAIVFIEADERDIGLVCFLAIGLAEVSSVEITALEGQHLWKGEEMGTFHYGGSSYCLVFTPSANLEWSEACNQTDAVIPVRSQIAMLKN